MSISTPSHLVENWTSWYGAEQTAQILLQLETRLEEATRRWGLSNLNPLPHGAVAHTFAAECSIGPVIVKLTPLAFPAHLDEAMVEGQALRYWSATHRTPKIHGLLHNGLTILMEKIEDSRVADLLPPPNQVTLLARAARSISQIECPREPTAFAHISQSHRKDEWVEILQERSPELLETLHRLIEPAPTDRLLHQDLHSRNILIRDDGYWIIDPKPLIGDPHGEVFGLLTNRSLAALEANPTETIGQYARVAGLDPKRLSQWLAIRSLTTANWTLEAKPDWGKRLMVVHEVTKKLALS